jgi:hypothetical protein
LSFIEKKYIILSMSELHAESVEGRASFPKWLKRLGGAAVGAAVGTEAALVVLGVNSPGLAIGSLVTLELGAFSVLTGVAIETFTETAETNPET